MSGEIGPGGEVAVYEGAGGEVRVDVRLDRDTVWVTQRHEATTTATRDLSPASISPNHQFNLFNICLKGMQP